MNLSQSLRYEKAFNLAAVGSGGKTTAIFQLARELPPPVFVTTTTHLHDKQVAMADSHYVVNETKQLESIFNNPHGVILITGPQVDERVLGLEKQLISSLHGYCLEKYPLLIEADGSRQLPLKAPAYHEPVIPDFVDMVLLVAGVDAIGKPLSDSYVHRAEIFSRLSGLPMNQTITLESVVKYLLNPEGGLKGIPSGAKRVALLTHGKQFIFDQSKSLVVKFFPQYDAVITASFQTPINSVGKELVIESVQEPVTAIILAAGEARRFGSPKQLIPWSGKPLIRHIVETTLASKVNEVILVTGADSELVENVVKGLQIVICRNLNWEEGISSSIRTGLQRISPKTGAVVFILADQPALSSSLIDKLIEAHNLDFSPIVAPQVNGEQTNPVLFDKLTFRKLFTLHGNNGGKQLFSSYPVSLIPWDDELLPLDIDTKDDYHKLLFG